MYSKIMLAVDLGEESSWRKALPTAAECCKTFGATLLVMTVVPNFGSPTVAQYFPEDFADTAMAAARKELEALTARHVPKDITVTHGVAHGGIYEEVLKTAEKNAIDLIVMASHRPELSDYLLGPNAARVVRHADCSVLVVRE